MGNTAETFVIDEEECFVLHHGTAESSPELILIERGLLAVCRTEKSACVEDRVAIELPGFAVKLIGAALDRCVDDCSGGASELRTIVAGLDSELGQGIRVHLDYLIGKALVAGAVSVVINTVQQKIVQLASLPVHVKGSIATAVRLVLQRRARNARHQQGQVGVGPAIQRQVHNLFRIDHLAARTGVGLKE